MDPALPNYDRIRDQVLAPIDLTEAQVTAAWLKVANPQPTVPLPDANADAFRLVEQMGDTVRALKVRYPSLPQVFVSSRIYAGHATTGLNPADFAADGTHPSALGREKVGGMLLDFMLTSPSAAPWFAVPEPAGVWMLPAGWLLATRRRRVMPRGGTPFSTRRTSVRRG